MPDRFDTHEERTAYKAGQVDQRLDDYAEHFKVVNGSIEAGAEALAELVKVVLVLDTRLKTIVRVIVIAIALIGLMIAIANFLTAH